MSRWLPVIAAFGAGLVLGVILSYGPDGSMPVTLVRPVESVGSSPPPLPPDQPGMPAVERPAVPSPKGVSREGWGTFEVVVMDADGKQVEATVYALPAGSVGVEWGEVTYADYLADEPCRLRLPVAGTYDIGAAADDLPLYTLSKGLSIEAGQTVQVALRLSAGQPIRIEAKWPEAFKEDLASGRLKIWLQIRSLAKTHIDWPGESGTPRISHSVKMKPADGPWTSVPLPPDQRFTAVVGAKVAKQRAGAHEPTGWRFRAEPESVLAGGTITVTAEPSAYIHLWPKIENYRAWPSGQIRLDVRLEQGERTGTWNYLLGWPAQAAQRRNPLILTGEPGPAVIRWDGPGVLAGESDEITLTAGRPLRVEMPLRLDPRELPLQEPIPIRLTGLPKGKWFAVEAALPGNETWPETMAEDWDEEALENGEELRLAWDYRRAKHLLAWGPDHLVCAPVEIPRSGGITLPFSQGGMLLLAPELLPREGDGELWIRRKDGLPFLHQDGLDYEPELRLRTEISTGGVIGPLPVGRHEFEVTLGGKRLPVATGTVKAGRIEILRIRF